MDQLAIALFLATVNLSIISYLSAPLRKKYPLHDFWWLLYAALVSGFLIGWFAEINLFAPYLPNLLVGRILTAILIGGGSSLLHDAFGSSPSDGTVTTIESATPSTTTVQVEDE